MPDANSPAIDKDNNPSPTPDGGIDGRKYDGSAGADVRPSETVEDKNKDHYVNGEKVSAEEYADAEKGSTPNT